MAHTKYTKSYSVLGVFQDDGWEMIRAAYRRQIKRWHPDRLQDPNHRKIAEEKSKEINQAYQNLNDYYREFGVLPPDHTSEQTVTSTTQDKWTVPEQHYRPETNHASFEESSKPKRRNYTFKVVFAGIAIALVYAFSDLSFLDLRGTNEMVASRNPGQRPDNSRFAADQNGYGIASDSGAPRMAAIPDNATNAHTNHWINNDQDTKYDLKSRANVINKNTRTSPNSPETTFDTSPTSPAASVRPVFITKGSSKNEVLALHGSPLRQTETEWDYGLSRIYFYNGKVIGWYEHPMNPLIVAR